jgi:hypothetical protein
MHISKKKVLKRRVHKHFNGVDGSAKRAGRVIRHHTAHVGEIEEWAMGCRATPEGS